MSNVVSGTSISRCSNHDHQISIITSLHTQQVVIHNIVCSDHQSGHVKFDNNKLVIASLIILNLVVCNRGWRFCIESCFLSFGCYFATIFIFKMLTIFRPKAYTIELSLVRKTLPRCNITEIDGQIIMIDSNSKIIEHDGYFDQPMCESIKSVRKL